MLVEAACPNHPYHPDLFLLLKKERKRREEREDERRGQKKNNKTDPEKDGIVGMVRTVRSRGAVSRFERVRTGGRMVGTKNARATP